MDERQKIIFSAVTYMDEALLMEKEKDEKKNAIEVNDFMDRIVNYFFVKYPQSQKVLPLYLKMKELMMYGLFGLGTFLIAIFTYMLFTETLKMNVLIGNALSWILATGFAFLTNRKWVFPVHEHGYMAFFKQLVSFTGGRLLTLGIEEVMLGVLVQWLQLPNMPIKLVAQFIVISLNYFFSKALVFNKKKALPQNKEKRIQDNESC